MKKKIIIISCLLALLLFSSFVYIKYVSTKKLTVREYKISSSISDEYYGLKIVHFGDIHYGKNIDKNYLENVVKEINLLKPDIVVFTGNLVDKSVELDNEIKDELVNILSKIDYNLGKYCIKGNEDKEEYSSLMKKSDFIYLDDNYEYIYKGDKPILISDMDSNNLENINSTYNILLVHEPDKILNMDYSKYNLILGGHSLNGLIKLPFIGPLFKYEGSKTYYDEYYDLGNTKLYITGGIGTYNFNLRINNRPSINLYRLVK